MRTRTCIEDGGTAQRGLEPHRLSGSRHSRREFLVLAGGITAGAALLAACGDSTQPASSTPMFHSRPDLKPPLIDVRRGHGTPGTGYICVTPAGPMLVDNEGALVWMQPVPHASTNLKVQTLNGEPVLTWWEGEIESYGVAKNGQYVVADSSYRTLMKVQAKNGLAADLHEFIIIGDSVAYFTAYRSYTADLRSVGGPRRGRALDATIQGIDLNSGTLVFDWSSAAHIDFSESHAGYSSKAPFDPVHLNSIDVTSDGKLLVSARNTWAVYKIDPVSGDIIWRLGGKKSDFALGPGVRFAWQHDARAQADGTITLFDDQGDPPEAKQSRGLALAVDEAAKTARLKSQYFHPDKNLLAGSQGSVQVLPSGNVLIGWGAEPYYTELGPDGALVLDGKFATGSSYRALRSEWTGQPTDRPAVASSRSPSGPLTLFASWNGSTETAAWRPLAGRSASSLAALPAVRKQGFETQLPAPSGVTHAAVAALDASGAVLAVSQTIKV